MRFKRKEDVQWSNDANVLHFRQEDLVIHLIKGFGKVKKYGVYLARLVETVGEVAEGGNEL